MTVTPRYPAAFRRLCVETGEVGANWKWKCQPPLGGCVLKQDMHVWLKWPENPAAFRRLCVETINGALITASLSASRL